MVKPRFALRLGPIIAVFSVLFFVLPESTQARPAVVTIGVDARFTDNAQKIRSGGESDIESRALLGITHTSDVGACSSDLSGQLAYSHWLDKTFGPETSANMAFLGDCRLSPNLTWQLSDYLTDTMQNSRSSGTPDERAQKNVFSTGPVVTLRLSPVDELVLSAAYENTEFEEPDQKDGERYSGSAGWNHFFSPSFVAGLSAGADQAELDTEEEIDRLTFGLPFTKSWPVTVLSGSLGYGLVETSFINGRVQDYETFVGNLLLVRQINQATEIELEVSQELTDQTTSFDSRFENFIFDLDQTSAVEVTVVRFGVNNELVGGAEFDADFFANRSDYLDTIIEEESIGVDFEYRRPVTGQLTASAGARYEYQTFSLDSSEDEILLLNAGIAFQLNRQLDFVSRVGFEKRESDIRLREFDEAWILVGLRYQFR